MEHRYNASLKKDLKLLQNAIRKNNRVVCEELQERYQAFLPSSLVTSEELASIHKEDVFSLMLMPEDIPVNLKPRKVLGDGNCLFNAGSVCVVGNESLALVLRLLTAAELFLQQDFYADHPRIKGTDSGFSESGKFMMSLSIDIQDGRNRIAAIKKQALSTCCDKRWAGLMEMMALSSVIGHVIHSVYPTCSPLFHGPIVPRMGTPLTSCYIMWTRDSALDNDGPFQPNHFVPLFASSEKKEPVTFADIVKRGSLKHPPKTKEAKGKKCPSMSEWIADNNARPTPFSGKERKSNDTKTAENPLAKRCDDEEEQNEGTSAVEIPSVAEFVKEEEEEEGVTVVETPLVEECCDGEQQKEETSEVETPSVEEIVREEYAQGSTAKETPSMEELCNEQQQKEGTSTMETPSVKEFVNEEAKGEESTVVKTPPMEECVDEEDQAEITSAVETPPVEESVNKKGKQHGQEKLPKRANEENTCFQEKKHENTAFSTASGQSFSSLSLSLRHIMEPSLRHARRKFSSTSYPVSTSASLCKHLSKTKNEDNGHGFGKGVQGKKRKERQNEENQGRQKMFFGRSHAIKSSEDELCANLPTKQRNDERKQVPSILPLHTGHDWYVERGRNESKNRARLQSRTANVIDTEGGNLLGTNRSTVGGTLQQNLQAIEDKIEEKESWKEKSRLVGIKAVGEQIYKFPILSTQEAARLFLNASKETVHGESCDEAMKRKNSMEVYEALSKHLNLLQVYIHGKAFLIENRSSPLTEVVINLKSIFDSFDFRERLNSHIEKRIGECYKNALAYLDTKRDRDTVKYLLTQITSVRFMAKLQGTANKHSLQNCVSTVPGKLEKFKEIMQDVTAQKSLSHLSPNEQRGLIRRQKDLIKERDLRHRFKSSQNISGRKLKIEEFPDIAAILEYEFGEGDRIERGGGGLESHPKLTNDILYRAADNVTNMTDARLALLSLAPENFSISLSTCYNYTQNFRKGTREAKRHHEGRGINACVSLHKAPDTAPIKDLVIDVHWSSSNVNAILDEAAQNPTEVVVDSYDAKQVVRPTDRHNLKTWRPCEYEDHTYDQSRQNAITPMSHLFLKTEETSRESRLSSQLDQNKLDVLLGSSPGKRETIIHQKRTGKAVTVLRLSHYENETVFRSINEFLFLMTLPHLDSYFRDPITGKLKQNFVFVVDNGVDKPRSPLVGMLLVRLQRYLGIKKVTQVSFAEYHSKRNPVERVHASEERELAKHGPFARVTEEPNTPEHKQAMEGMAEQVREVFSHAKFGGEPILCVRGQVGRENFIFDDEEEMHTFLALTEQRKLECPLAYKTRRNALSAELSNVWGVDDAFEAEYAEDYQLLTNDSGSDIKTAWRDKYTTTIFDDSSLIATPTLQPVPDYVRWYLSGGKMHYLPFEQRRDLVDGPWNRIPELFLPSRILQLVFLSLSNLPTYGMQSISMLCWCPLEEIEKFLRKKADDMEKDILDSAEKQLWRQHPLYKENRETLEAKCKEKGAQCSGAKHLLVKRLASLDSSSTSPVLDVYSGDISTIPTAAKEIQKLPVGRLKAILHFHNIPTEGSKDHLVLRVLAVRTGTTHLLFERELKALEDLINVSKILIGEEIKLHAIVDRVVYRERSFKRDATASLSETRPREHASVSNQDHNIASSTPIPEGISLLNLNTIFDEIQRLITAQRELNNKKADPSNSEAIRTPGTRVAVLWSKEDALSGWEPGWYTGVVRAYDPPSDKITIEYSSEKGERYQINVKESIAEGKLKVLKVTCDSDLYDEVTEIGARIQVLWTKDDVVKTGWKPGWYFAEVQGFEPDDDIISIVYEKEPKRVYQESVTTAISRGEIRLAK